MQSNISSPSGSQATNKRKYVTLKARFLALVCDGQRLNPVRARWKVGLCVADDHFLSGQEAGFVPPFLALLSLLLPRCNVTK